MQTLSFSSVAIKLPRGSPSHKHKDRLSRLAERRQLEQQLASQFAELETLNGSSELSSA
ncbi:Unknown protein sequence [Pseudomonas syringae pv. maculicola]|nr:Unknown protein sequence [Pseudomonas syringae pv. maculicola]